MHEQETVSTGDEGDGVVETLNSSCAPLAPLGVLLPVASGSLQKETISLELS